MVVLASFYEINTFLFSFILESTINKAPDECV